MKRIRLLLTALLISVSSMAFAQNIQVTGVVTDASTGESVPGVAIQLKGSLTNYSMSDITGAYGITVPSDGILVFSFLGFTTQEIAVNGRNKINVALTPDAEMLEDAIVVGYGTAKKISAVVGAATSINKKVLANAPVASVGDALQGQVAGLQVFTSSGEPSATVSMRLRGVNSINASNSPLFILDGSPVSSSVFTTLNSNDIANVTVLKDASSTAIYGSRAANGVVYITTKTGSGETPTVKLSTSYGISNLASNPQTLMNSEEWFRFREMADPALKTNDQFQALKKFRLDNNISCDWRKWILNENAPTWSADLSISGRTAKTDYYISYGAFDQTGVEPYSSMSRYNARSNINTRINSWLKTGINLNLTYQSSETAGYSGTGNSWYNPVNVADWSLPYTTPYEIKVGDNGEFLGYGDELDHFDSGLWNYFYLMDLQPSNESTVRLNGNTYEEFTPIKGLVIRAEQAIEAFDWRNSSKVLNDQYKLFTTRARESFSRSTRLTSTNTAEYKFNVADDHNFILLAGQEAIVNNYDSFRAGSKGQTDNRTMNVNQGTTYEQPTYSKVESSYNSFFGRLSYDYLGRYNFDATVRRDGSSLFGANRKYATFWSVGGMWNLMKEDFMSDADWAQNLQFRASYGTTGNSGIDEYLADGKVGTSSVYGDATTWALASASNPDLTWETVEALNIGVNARLFNFMSIEIDFYNKNTKNMLMSIPYSYATGFDSGWGNVGTMRNRGVDMTLGFDVINNSDFYFNITGNLNYNKNAITELFGGRDEFIVPNTGIKYQVGKSYGDFFYVRYAGVDPATGKQLWLDKDGKLTDTYSDDDAVFTGKQRYAPWAAGLQLNFSWKGLSVGAYFSGVFGKWTVNNSRYFSENANFSNESNQSVVMFDMWTTPGAITSIPAATEKREFDTHLLEDASFVRLKNLQISYDFPKAWWRNSTVIHGLRVYGIGRNLLTFTKYTGYDPEVDSNLQLGNYPNSKQYTLGVEFTF